MAQSAISRQPDRFVAAGNTHVPRRLLSRKPTARTFHRFIFLFTCVLFLSSSFAENVVQWRVPEGGETAFGSTAINALTFSADGSQLVVASTNGIALYDTYTGEARTRFPVFMNDLTAVALSPAREEDGGQTVASVGEDAIVRLWDARTGEHISDLIGHADPVVVLAFSPDGNILASGSFKEIRLWNLTARTASRAAVLHGHRDMVTTLAFSPDGKRLASTSFYGTILLWDVQTGQLRHRLSTRTDSILTLAFSPDNEILASGGYWSPEAESTIHIWNPHTGQLLATVEDHTVPVFALAFSPDVHSEVLASAGWGDAIHIWDPRDSQLLSTFEGDAAPIVALAFNGGMLASVSLDGTIRLQSLRSVRGMLDVNGDGVVNILDLTFVASRFGESSPDLNGDGVVNILDLGVIANRIGE